MLLLSSLIPNSVRSEEVAKPGNEPSSAKAPADSKDLEILRLKTALATREKQDYYVDIYRRLRPTSVSIDYTPDKGGGLATGVLVDFDFGRGILTCAHNVVGDNQKAIDSTGEVRYSFLLDEAKKSRIKIVLPDGKVIYGKTLIKDGKAVVNPERDLSIVVPDAEFKDLVLGFKSAVVANEYPSADTPVMSVGNFGGAGNVHGMNYYVGKAGSQKKPLIGRPGHITKVFQGFPTTNARGGESGSGNFNISTDELIGITTGNVAGDAANDAITISVESIHDFLKAYGLKLSQNSTSTIKGIAAK